MERVGTTRRGTPESSHCIRKVSLVARITCANLASLVRYTKNFSNALSVSVSYHSIKLFASSMMITGHGSPSLRFFLASWTSFRYASMIV